jgi:protein O-GlcNAc transferase
VYLCHQNLRKWHPRFDALLETICATDPRARLVCIADKQVAITQALTRRLARSAPAAAARLTPIGFLDKPRYLDLLSVADVALDTRPYGGGANTVYDAIAVGTPIVTWPAEIHRGRWAKAALERIDVPELVVNSAEAYCELVVRIAMDRELRDDVSDRLRRGGPELFQDARTVAEHRRFFLQQIARLR